MQYKHNGQSSVSEPLYTNPRQEGDRPERYYTNTGNLNSKSNNIGKPTVNNNEINYFLPGPNQENDKKVSAEIKQ